MVFSLYQQTELEQWIYEKYRVNRINKPSDLDIELVGHIFGVDIKYYSGPPASDWVDDLYGVIMINSLMHPLKKREHFFHELCHILKHAGDQRDPNMSTAFKELQEIQARCFQLYASMPFYMIVQLNLSENHDITNVQQIAAAFEVSEEDATERLVQIERRIIQHCFDSIFIDSIRPKKFNPAEWSYETKQIMDKLSKQLKSKRDASYG